MSDEERKDPEAEKGMNHARRRLLRLAVYVPPIVIGAISLQQAGCQPDPTCSCAPHPQSCGTTPAPPPSNSGPADKAPSEPDPES